MSILDIIIFLFFTGGVVVFGCSFFNKKRSSEEFTSAGRSLPGWVVGMSIFATYVSSISYLAYPGKAYMSDWNAFVFSLSIPIASYFAAKYFVPFYRSIGSVSAYSFLEERFGPWARVYASSCYLLTQVARLGERLTAGENEVALRRDGVHHGNGPQNRLDAEAGAVGIFLFIDTERAVVAAVIRHKNGDRRPARPRFVGVAHSSHVRPIAKFDK